MRLDFETDVSRGGKCKEWIKQEFIDFRSPFFWNVWQVHQWMEKTVRVAHRSLEKKMYQVTERIKKVEESGNARGKVICNPR